MATVVNLPGPEPDWESAASGQGRRNNPVRQVSLWERADGFRHVAVLRVRFADIVLRLRLMVEESWEDLGPVEVATFRLGGTDLAVSHLTSEPDATDVHLKSVDEPEARREAVSRLLALLGTDESAVAYWRTPEGTYEAAREDGEVAGG